MNGITTLILILAPMFVGYLLPSHPKAVQLAEKLLNYVVFLILLIIGIELGLVENLHQKISHILSYLLTLLVLTISTGTLALFLFDKYIAKSSHHATKTAKTTPISLKGSLVQLVCLAIGFVFAKVAPASFMPPEHSNTALLMALLFLVGISLKGSGIHLKQVLLNKLGLQISLIFMTVTTASGLVFAGIFDNVSATQGLALASAYGWYSLSGSLMTDAYGAIWGSVALLNDLSREVLALIFIPYLMRYSPASAVGLGGVTSLDFTLPTITQSGGVQIVPLAISFGFITNVVSPVLMVFFSSFG